MMNEHPSMPELGEILSAVEFDAIRHDHSHPGAWVAVNVLAYCASGDGFVYTIVAADEKWSTPSLRCSLKEAVELQLQDTLQSQMFSRHLEGKELVLLLKPAKPTDEHDGIEIIGIDPCWIENWKRIRARESMRQLALSGLTANQHSLADPVDIKRIGILWDTRDPNIEEVQQGLGLVLPAELEVIALDADFSEADEFAPTAVSRFRRLIEVHLTTYPLDLIVILHSGASPTYRMMGSALARDITHTNVPVIVGMPRGRNRSLIHQVSFDAGDSVGEALVLLQQLFDVRDGGGRTDTGVRH